MIRLFIALFSLVFCSSCMLQYAAGLSQIQQEKYEQATYNFSVALSKDPKNPEIYFARAFSRGSMEQYSGAISDLTKAIRLDSTLSLIHI
jgi:Tfp pilus assembly protein PilF